jgi:hypothetical protein
MPRRLMILALVAVVMVPAACRAAELVMVRAAGCAWCLRWDAEIGPAYPKTDEGRMAPLRELDMNETSEAGIGFDGALLFTPTFVLVEDGREIGRIEGYAGDEFFWPMLGRMLQRLNSDNREEER